MEVTQLHSLRPITIEETTRELRSLLGSGLLHPRASAGLALKSRWRPADLWPGTLERIAWTVAIESRGPLLTARGEERLGDVSATRRLAPVTPLENLAIRRGEGLVLVHSDAAQLAYVSVWRERRLAFSLLLHDRVRLVRCDGAVVMHESPPKWVAEGDRTGVLLEGLHRWLREPIPLDRDERFTLPDVLAALTGDEPLVPILRDGEWDDEGDAPGAARISAG
jgi:hypothetical protein